MANKDIKSLDKSEISSKNKDIFLWLVSIACLLGSIYGYYQFSEQLQVVRILIVLTGIGAFCFVASRTAKGKKIYNFLLESRREIRLFVWPTRSETVQMTLMIFVAVVIVGIFLWIVDSFFLWIVRLLTS